MHVARPPLVAGPLLRQRLASLTDDSFGFSQPTGFTIRDDALTVVDTGNDRLVVLDLELQPRRTIGRSGAGPGEFQVPLHLEVWNGRYVVGELTNQRLSFFKDGSYLKSLALPAGLGAFGLGADQTAYVASHASGHYLWAVDSLGKARPLAARALEYYRAADRDERGLPRGVGTELVAVTGGDIIHVLDNQLGVLLKYDSSGRQLLARSLPPQIRARLIQERQMMLDGLHKSGIQVLAAPLIKSMIQEGSDQLLLLFGAGELFGLLVHAGDYTARLLRVPSPSGVWTPVTRATAARIRGGTLYVLDQNGIYVYALAAARS